MESTRNKVSRLLTEAQHPMPFGSFRTWLRVLLANRDVDAAYLHRVAFISLVSLITSPLRVYERQRLGTILRERTLGAPPIFIVGHWRSGTTHLHNLLCQDVALGYLTTYQAIAPDLLFVGERTLKPLLRRLAPTTRPMDNMVLSMDGPQEEEPALAMLSPYSYYHYWSFPRHARRYFKRYVLFQGVPNAEAAAWKALYQTVLKKAEMAMGGRRMVVKNPVNTGRIPQVLELFPDARFIHIYRNPYDVLLSMRHHQARVLRMCALQRIRPAAVESDILLFYQLMMRKFLADRRLIPAANLVEVRF